MISSLQVVVGTTSFQVDASSCLVHHDPRVDMSPVPAEDDPADGDDEQQDTDEQGDKLVPRHCEEGLPATTHLQATRCNVVEYFDGSSEGLWIDGNLRELKGSWRGRNNTWCRFK